MRRATFFVAMLMSIQAWAQTPVKLNSLRSLKVSPQGNATQITVEGTSPPTFTVFRLHEPERLVIDLTSADATAIKGPYDGLSNVAGILASQFSDGQSNVGRVLISLRDSAPYDVRAEGNRVVVRVDSVAEAGSNTEQVTKEAAVNSSQGRVDTKPTDVVKNFTDEKFVETPAKRLKKVLWGKNSLQILTDGEVARFDVLELLSPPRLAIDLFGLKNEAHPPKGLGAVREIRVGPHADKVRLVVEWHKAVAQYNTRRTRSGLILEWVESQQKPTLTKGEPSEVSFAEIDGKRVALEPEEKADSRQTMKTALADIPVEVLDLRFHEAPSGGMVELKLKGKPRWKVERPNRLSAVLTLRGARLAENLERSLDTSDLTTPIRMVSAFAVPDKEKTVRIVVSSAEVISETVVESTNRLSWKFSSQGVQTEQMSVRSQAAAESVRTSVPAEEERAGKSRFRGKAVSFEFKDIDIHNLLRMIAEVSKKNIVVADDVTGRVTIRLRNVPWDQALELILRSKGLGKEDLGNIIRVAPLRALEEEAKLREERRKSMQRQEELLVQLIAVNYASATDLSSRIKEILSERGSVAVDVRTNTLIVRDISSSIVRAKGLVKSLDTQTPQVLIESRIVEANTNFSRQVGIQWGGNAQMAQSTGNSTGLVFPNTVVARGGSTSESSDGVATPPNFAVNLPAAVGTGAGGALGFVFGSAGGAVALNLRLSALENQGAVKTISAPKVTTLDNSPARISQGVSIPFSQVSAGGVNTTFVEARLSLEVTPHITADGSILMTIRAENNQPDPANTGANGQPSIQRKEANTQVLVKDGDTTVIGGIYVRRGSTATRAVPFLSKIPILGFFFKNVSESDVRQELLIFITPRIITQPLPAQAL